MSVFNEKSTQISNADATPLVRSDGFLAGGELSSAIGSCTTGSSADAVGSTYRLCRIPSKARVHAIAFQNTALAGSAAVNVGVYWPTVVPAGSGLTPSNAGSAISASLFASALSVVAAAAPTDITNQSGNNTIAKQEQPLWQAAGLSSDPGIDLDIVAAVSTVFAATGTLGARVEYQY